MVRSGLFHLAVLPEPAVCPTGVCPAVSVSVRPCWGLSWVCSRSSHALLMGPVQNTCCSLPSRWCCLTLCRSPRCAPGSFRAVSSYTLNLQPCKSSRRGSAVISGGAQRGTAAPPCSLLLSAQRQAVDVLLTPPFAAGLFTLPACRGSSELSLCPQEDGAGSLGILSLSRPTDLRRASCPLCRGIQHISRPCGLS